MRNFLQVLFALLVLAKFSSAQAQSCPEQLVPPVTPQDASIFSFADHFEPISEIPTIVIPEVSFKALLEDPNVIKNGGIFTGDPYTSTQLQIASKANRPGTLGLSFTPDCASGKGCRLQTMTLDRWAGKPVVIMVARNPSWVDKTKSLQTDDYSIVAGRLTTAKLPSVAWVGNAVAYVNVSINGSALSAACSCNNTMGNPECFQPVPRECEFCPPDYAVSFANFPGGLTT